MRNLISKNLSVFLYHITENNTIEKDVRDIIDRVKSEGDEALRYFSKKYDGHDLDDIRVSKEDIELAYETVDPEIKEKIAKAQQNISTNL